MVVLWYAGDMMVWWCRGTVGAVAWWCGAVPMNHVMPRSIERRMVLLVELISLCFLFILLKLTQQYIFKMLTELIFC